MLRFFRAVQQRVASDREIKMILELSKNSNNSEALKACTKLVEQYPYDAQIRHRLAILQQAMGQEIHLPDITPR